MPKKGRIMRLRSVSSGVFTGTPFDMTGATVSYHLSQLKKAGLVFETKREGIEAYCPQSWGQWLAAFHTLPPLKNAFGRKNFYWQNRAEYDTMRC